MLVEHISSNEIPTGTYDEEYGSHVYNLLECSSLNTHMIPLKVCGIHTVDQVLQQQLTNQNNQERKKLKLQKINPLKTNGRLLYLKVQFVPRSKHFSSRLYKPISLWHKWH